MICTCPKPVENINPRNVGLCVKCSKALAAPECEPSVKNLGAFFERLAESSFPSYSVTHDRQQIPTAFYNFYRECEGRMKAGNKMPEYKWRYLARNNPAESQEEAADLANYLFLETLRRRRLGEDEEADAALTGALHAYKAYEIASHLLTHTFPAFSDADTEGPQPTTSHN